MQSAGERGRRDYQSRNTNLEKRKSSSPWRDEKRTRKVPIGG